MNINRRTSSQRLWISNTCTRVLPVERTYALCVWMKELKTCACTPMYHFLYTYSIASCIYFYKYVSLSSYVCCSRSDELLWMQCIFCLTYPFHSITYVVLCMLFIVNSWACTCRNAYIDRTCWRRKRIECDFTFCVRIIYHWTLHYVLLWVFEKVLCDHRVFPRELNAPCMFVYVCMLRSTMEEKNQLSYTVPTWHLLL